MDSLGVVVVDILLQGLGRFRERILRVTPDLLVFDGPDDSFDVGIIVGGVVAGVLPGHSRLGQVRPEVLGARLTAVIASQGEILTSLLG